MRKHREAFSVNEAVAEKIKAFFSRIGMDEYMPVFCGIVCFCVRIPKLPFYDKSDILSSLI